MVCKMKEMLMKCKIKVLFLLIFLISCGPTVINDSSANSMTEGKTVSGTLSSDDIEECADYQNWQGDYWKNKNYRRCIYCNLYMLDLNCDLSEHSVNYYNLARSFIEINAEETKADSAFWALNLGLSAKGENEALLELGAYIAKKANSQEQRIYYLERVLEINEQNQRALEQLSDIFSQNEQYEEQVEILDQWLEIKVCAEDDPPLSEDDETVCMQERKYNKAIGEKKRAYDFLGYETSDVDLERWESDKSSIVYGITLLRALEELEKLDDLIERADEILYYDEENTVILGMKAEAQETLFDYEAALETYEQLYEITDEPKHAINISKILITESNYKEAYNWAEKAVEASDDREKGESIFQRAEALLYLARSCEDKNINFWDKIVYQIALNDYREAYGLKYYTAGTRKKELEDNRDYYLPKPTDWALNASGVSEVCPSCKNNKVDVPLKDCYDFITRRVKK